MSSMTIVRMDLDYSKPASVGIGKTYTYIPLEAESDDKLFAAYFKQYDKRYQYCNNIHFSIQESAMSAKYREWISDVRNYADNGGDMW